MGRNTQGVRLINLTKDEKLIGMERIAESDEDDAVEGESEGDAGDEAE